MYIIFAGSLPLQTVKVAGTDDLSHPFINNKVGSPSFSQNYFFSMCCGNYHVVYTMQAAEYNVTSEDVAKNDTAASNKGKPNDESRTDFSSTAPAHIHHVSNL